MKGKRKRKPIAHRVIAFVLAFAMVFTSISFSDLGTKDVKAAETDGWYWETENNLKTLYIKDGQSINLYTALTDDSGINLDPKTGPYKYYGTYDAEIKYNANSAPQYSWDAQGTTAGTSAIAQGSYVAVATSGEKGGMATKAWTTTTAFAVKHYSIPSVTVTGKDGVKASDVPAKVIYGNDVTFTLPAISEKGWTAVVTTATDSSTPIASQTVSLSTSETTKITVGKIDSVADATITVTLRQAENYKVNVSIATDAPWGTATASATSSIAGETITITPTPNANTVNTIYAYDKITVNGVEQTGLTFTMPEKEVEVIVYFKKTDIHFGTDKNTTIEYNGWYSSANAEGYPLDTLKQEIFNKLDIESLPEGATWENVTIQYYPLKVGTLTGNSEYDSTCYDLNYEKANEEFLGAGYEYRNFGERAYNNGNSVNSDTKEKVRITYNGLYIEEEITLVEARKEATINYTKPTSADNPLVFETEDEIKAAVLAAAAVSGSSKISIEGVDISLPSGGEQTELTYKLSVADNENYLKAEKEVTIDVKAKEDPASINITVNGTAGEVSVGSLTANGTLTEGDYSLIAKPTTDKGYVASIKINGEEYAEEYEKYTDGVYSNLIYIKNQTTYNVEVTFAERNVSLKDGSDIDIAVNGFNSDTLKTSYLEKFVGANFVEYLTFVGGTVSASELIVKMKHENVIGGSSYDTIADIADSWNALGGATIFDAPETQKTVQITWEGNNRYPTVTSKDITVDIVESRPKLDISGTGTLVTYETADQGTAAIKASALAAANLPINPAPEATATIGALPEGLNHKTASIVEVTISITGDENYVASSGVVEVPVILKEKASTIAAKENIAEAGAVEITNSQNASVSSSTADTLNLSVNPEDGYYVKSVNIYETSTDAEGVVTNKTPAITQTEVTYTDATYTSKFAIESNTAYVVEIEYAEWILDVPTELEIAVNGYTGNGYTPDYSYRTDDLKNKILTAVLGETYDASKYTVEMYVNAKTDFIDLSGYYDIESTAFATAVGLGAFDVANEQTETVRITYVEGSEMYPDAIAETVIEFTESRAQATISQKVNSITVDAMPSTYDSWYEVTDPNGTVITDGVTAVLDSTALPAEGAENVPYKLTVSVAETENYTGATAEFTVLVTNPKYDSHLVFGDVVVDGEKLATITVKDATGNEVTSSDKATVPSGTYYVTVTPEKGAYIDYLIGATPLEQKWSNNVYTCEINVAYGDTSHPTITLDAHADKREIIIKNEIAPITFIDDKATLLKGVYTAAVAGSNPSGDDGIAYEDVTVKLANASEINKGATNEFIITWAATDKYPEVSATTEVFISENRVKADIDTTDAAVTGEGILTITKEEVDANGVLTEETKTAILNAISGIEVSDGALAPILSVSEWPTAPTQAGSVTVDVLVSVAENNRYLANTAKYQLTLYGDINDAEVTINAVENGTVTLTEVDAEVATADVTTTYSAGRYYVTLTPNKEYYIDSLKVVFDEETTTYTYKDFDENGRVVLNIINGRGKSIDYVPNYTLTATFIQPSITIAENATVKYFGQEAIELPAQIWKDVTPVTVPAGLTTGATIDTDPTVTEQKTNELTVYYLAREAAVFKETVTINLPVVGAQSFTVDVPVADQWLEISQEVPVGAGMPSQDEIQAIVDELLETYDWKDLLSMGTDGLKDLAEKELKGVYEEYYRFYNAHSFGKSETGYETVKAVYQSDRFGAVESNEAQITLEDTRAVTEIRLNENVEMTYGFTETDLTKALLDGVYAQDASGETVKVEDAVIEYITKVEGLNASEEAYTIKVSYAGNENYKHSTAETTILVNKAPVDVQVDNRLIKWSQDLEDNGYTMPVVTDPAGVDTINFIVGLNVSDINIDDNSIKGIMGEVQLMIPDSLQSILESVGIRDGVSMTVAELQQKLTAVSEALGWVNSENEVVTTLLNMLNSLPTDVADVTVRIGGTLPTDIGVYLVGAVSADGNYETNAGVGVVAITPDGKKAELGWIVEDDNNIITRTLLTDGTYDMGAQVTSVAEGSVEEAQEQVIELFLGLDIDGNIKIERDQTKLNVGAYTEVAMIVNWGNEFYYSEPIVRAFVVVAESLDLTFIDGTGAENNERHFVFDNTTKSMDDVLVTYKDGGATVLNTVTGEQDDLHKDENLKVYYVGAQTNANPYASTVPPTHAGAYTVTAVYTLRDAEGMVSHAGLNVGAMVIEPAKSDITVESQYFAYDKDTAHGVSDMVTATSAVEGLTPDTTVISAGITTNGQFTESAWDAIVGTVNVDFPTWLDELLQKYDILEAAYTEEGITAETFKAYVDKIEEILVEANISTDSITELTEMIDQIPGNTTLTFKDDVVYSTVGAYMVVGVVTDSDHYPSVDAGIMVIYPDATEVELKFEEDWNGNNIFTHKLLESMNLDASAYDLGTDNVNADATGHVTNIYFGINDDGDVILTDDKTVLDNGAYTQFAYLLDLGSEMFYAEPIARAFVIVPNPIDITFVDATGAENADRHFVYDMQPHAMDVVVSYNGEQITDLADKLTVTYTGVQSNGKLYNSTEAPIHTGAYTATAIYKGYADDKLIDYGMAVGAMVIEPAASTMDVANVAHEFDNQPYDTASMITATSAANDPDLDTTVITASLATDGNFSEEGLGAIEGAVNIDLPDYVDAVAKQVAALEAGYTGEGLSAEDFINILKGYEEKLSTLNITAEIYNGLMNILEQLPADTAVTFKEQADVAPNAIGAYLVIGMVTDTNHYPSMDAGVLVIYPNAQEAELDWRYVDDNNIYTLDALDVLDLGADAFLAGEKAEELSEVVETLYIGVDTENWEITLTDSQADLTTGVYTEMAYLLVIDGNTYYAEPISRPITVVPNVYNVNFHDGTQINNDRLFTFDNTAKSMGDVEITDLEGNVINPADGTLTVTYVGKDGTPGVYYGSEAPVHAGAYTVVATYVGRDADNDLAVGVGIGAMAIQPADATVNVDSQVVLEGSDYTIGVTATAADNVVNDTPKTLTILAGVDMDEYAEKGNLAFDGVVNVDFPTAVDNVLKEVVPEWYEHGIGTDAFFARYDEVVATVEAAGFDTSMFGELKSVLTELNAANLTFGETEEAKPTATGVYAILSMVFDPDYKSAVDTALLVIAPNATVADLEFKMDIPGAANIIPYEWIEKIDFGAQVENIVSTNPDVTADDVIVKDVIFGLTTDFEIFIGSSEDKPTELGVYDQVAYAEADTDFALVLPITRAFTVVKSTANVEFYDGKDYVEPTPNWLRQFVYDGEPQDMPVRMTYLGGEVVKDAEGNIIAPNVWYLGMENDIVVYSSDVAPTDVGTYQAIGYYFDEEANIYTVGLGAMVITEREVTITVDDQSMVVNGTMPELRYKVTEGSIPEAAPLDIEVVATTDGNMVGEFMLGAVVSENPNYKVTVVPGTLTVSERSLPIPEAIEDQEYEGKAIEPTVEIKDGETTLTLGTDYEIVGYENNVNVGTAKVTVKGIGNYEGTKTVEFAIVKVPLTLTVTDKTKVYGDNDPELTFIVDGLLGEDTESALDVTLSRAEGENVGDYTITADADAANYDIAVVDGALTITQAKLTVTVSDASKTYGDKDPNFKGSVKGTKFDDEIEIGYEREDGEDAGTYAINAIVEAGGNYEVVVNKGTFTINPKAITVTADNATKIYGEADPTFTYTADGLVGDDTLDVTFIRAEGEDVGEYAITASVEDANYVITVVNEAKLTITPAALPTASLASTSVEYNGEAQKVAVSIEGLTEGTDYTVSYSNDVTNAGKVTVTVNGIGNYAGSKQTLEYQITKANDVVTATLASWTFGEIANEATAATKSGLTATFKYYADETCTTEIAKPSDAGTYYVKAFTAGNNNYKAGESEAVAFTITPATLPTASLASASVEYNGQAQKVAVSIEGLTEGTDYTVSYSEDVTNAGKVTVTIEGIGNYAGSKQTLEYQITKASLVVTAEDKSKVYGEANPTFTVTYAGFEGNDTESVLEGTLDIACNGSFDTGTYTIIPSGVTAKNYNITFENGIFTVNAKDISEAVIAHESQVYAGSEWNTLAVLDGYTLIPGEDAIYTWSNNTNVGTATVIVKGTGNYTGEATLTFEITPVELTATVANAEREYGAANPEFTITYTGFVKNEDSSVITTAATATTTATTDSKVGTYPITASGAVAANYTFKYVDGTLTVTKAENSFTTPLTLEGWTYGDTPNLPNADAAFGGMSFLYYDADKQLYDGDITTADAGTYYVQAVVEGTDNYAGITSDFVAFTIAPKAITTATAADIADQTYTGSAITPSVVVKDGDKTLVEGTDYTVSYTNNTKPGEATITITGKGNYTGTKDVTFTIAKTIEQVIAELSLVDIEATGEGANSMYIRGFTVGETAESLQARLKAIEGATLKSFVNEANATKVATGMEFTLTINGVDYHRIMVVMGDTNGDGNIWATDYTLIKNQIMTEKVLLVDEYRIAADINRDDNIYATDYTAIKNYIMNGVEIDQSGAILQ